MDPTKSSNPTRVARLEETINCLKELGIEEVYVEVVDPDNICFTSVQDQKLYSFCYSKHIEALAKKSSEPYVGL